MIAVLMPTCNRWLKKPEKEGLNISGRKEIAAACAILKHASTWQKGTIFIYYMETILWMMVFIKKLKTCFVIIPKQEPRALPSGTLMIMISCFILMKK